MKEDIKLGTSVNSEDDFISFPTLPDPEQERSQTLTKLFTKTLRRVTNNASLIVQAYSSPKSVNSDSRDIDGINDTPIKAPGLGNIMSTNSSIKEIQDKSKKLQDAIELVPRHDFRKPDIPRGDSRNSMNNSDVELNDKEVPSTLSKPPTSTSINLKEPVVKSDSKTLRFQSNLPTLEPTSLSGSVTNSVLNVNALANTETQVVNGTVNTGASEVSSTIDDNDKTVTKKNSKRTLLNRISSIFNNLPNDIELSDDSASDTDTIHDSNPSPTQYRFNNFHKVGSVPPPELSMHSESIVQSSPVKAEQSRSHNDTSTLNSFHALKQFNNGMKKKVSSNLSTSLIDNAKSILNQNFPGNLSSASSIIGDVDRKKKKKSKRVSDNPLKSGGIPRKYWMNDSFVSECLNCFKPFSAFRRKHHCRFCGQIFCSDCTLFVSYSQHKEERKTGNYNNPERKHYSDKLRVCKPCYSDVIVYLSDSDSSSSDEEVDDDAVSFETIEKMKIDDSLPQHPFHRARSQSTNSRRELISNHTSVNSNSDVVSRKSFANKSSYPDMSSERYPNLSSSDIKTPQGISIATTRQGESVEIPVSKNIHSNNNFLNPGGSIHRTQSNDYTNNVSSSWLKKYPSLRKSGTGLNAVSRSNSVDNLSSIHGKLGSGKLSKIKSHTENEGLRKILTGDYAGGLSARSSDQNLGVKDGNKDSDQVDDDDELESENEDEQVMSLYTSLNHAGYNQGITSSTISPRAPITRPLATVSASAVPTLGEFPTMMVNEKLYPKNMRTNLAAVIPRIMQSSRNDDYFESNSPFSRNVLEDNPKSNLRSHERAHASLLRMRSRRRAKTVRNVLLFSQNNAKLLSQFEEPRDSVSPPVSPSPNNEPSINPMENRSFLRSNETIQPLANDNFSPQTVVTYYGDDNPTAKHQVSFGSFNTSKGSALPDKLLMQQSSGLFDEVENKIDTVYLDLFNRIFKQCMEDCDIKDNVQKWREALTRIISFVNGLHFTDTLDIKQYVKIKRIAGSIIDKTDLVDGVVMTKNIDSKRMANKVDNPKIALLMFPIEYLKQKEQFISLRIVQSQQTVHITNLVSRIISLKPDIVVVGDTVCQLAVSLLEEAKITVISNTKPQVIERISRYTKGDIFQSVNDLFFKKGNLGICKKFEVKKFLHNNVIKTFSYFTGTDTDLGFTIVLRGSDEETLNSIKYTAENLLLAQVNAKFEKSYFDDHLLTYIDESPHESVSSVITKIGNIKEEVNSGLVVCETMPDEKEILEYVDLFISRIISTSPFSKYSLPSPLENALKAFMTFYNHNKQHKLLLDCETLDDVQIDLIDDLKLNFDLDQLPNQSQDLLEFLKYVSDSRLKKLAATFQSRSRTWGNLMKMPCYQLYPVFHKSIHLLYSNVSIKNNIPCNGPNIIVVDFYTDNDKFLGLQLDEMFSDSFKECEECGELLFEHYKNYVHGNGKLDMIIERYESLPPEHLPFTNQRTVWSVCKQCNFKSPVVAMSDDTYYMSIGKYFEASFWGKNMVLNHKCDCEHDFFKDHVKYFGFNEMAIKIAYTPIDTFEVVVPTKQLEYDPAIEINLKIEALESIRSKTNKFFQSISKRLNRVKVDTFDKQEEDGSKRIEELKKKLQEQETNIRQETLNIYELTLPTVYLPLNSILRKLQELGVEWDDDFNDFEVEFLPSENEITRITQSHLRNFLLDRFDDKEVEMEDMKEKKPLDDKDHEIEPPVDLKDERSEEIDKLIPKALLKPQTNVGHKISKMEALLQNETQWKADDKKKKLLNHKESDMSLNSTLSTSSQPSTVKNKNKVSQLTSFFDQMNFDQISMEFKKQRELELRKNLNKFRALPIVASKPIVEIYNNIEDVVDVDEIEERKKAMKINKSDELKSTDTKPEDDEKKVRERKEKILDIPQPEKVSLLKSLTNFWADRSASLWDPLEYPLDRTEHTFADSDIIVREDEPSSLVAFCLSTNDYKQKIKEMAEEPDMENPESHEVDHKKLASFGKIEKKFKSRFDNGGKPSEIENLMTKTKSTHLKYQFTDGSTELSCKIFYSEQFNALRRSCSKEDQFIQSLSRCVKWNSSGGKSGSNFLKTLDNRFIVKELSKSELESFVSMAPFYFKYISQSMFNTLTTALAKIFGFYQIHIKNTITGKTFKMDFLIMENLFYNTKTTRIFDLKGSMRNRHVTQTGQENEVLLDENMIEYIYESPVFVKENLKKLLRGSLFNDTSFLSAMEVMDYSLIIGINDTSNKLYIGIIDWLRTFTWDKKVENWVKGNNLIGGNKKGKDPTIVTPKQYRIRFREAMERYILEVPDIWYEGKN